MRCAGWIACHGHPKRKTFVAEFSAIIPWVVLLTVFAAMAALGAQQFAARCGPL
jgi:hypothetical protein